MRHFSDFLTKLGAQKGSVEIEARVRVVVNGLEMTGRPGTALTWPNYDPAKIQIWRIVLVLWYDPTPGSQSNMKFLDCIFELRKLIATDGHAPEQYRAVTVRNLDAWYDAFSVHAPQKLYLAPTDRAHIW